MTYPWTLLCAGQSILQEEVSCFSAPDLPGTALQPVHFSSVTEDDARLWILGDGIFGAGLGTDGLIAVLADVHTPHEVELPVHQFWAIPPDRQILDAIGAWTGCIPVCRLTSQALHPQQAYSSIISACLFMAGPLLSFRDRSCTGGS